MHAYICVYTFGYNRIRQSAKIASPRKLAGKPQKAIYSESFEARARIFCLRLRHSRPRNLQKSIVHSETVWKLVAAYGRR